MMQPTTDLTKLQTITKGDARFDQSLAELAAAGRLIALESNGGVMLFIRTNQPEEWRVTIAFKAGGGASTITDINDGLKWMFVNTDAVRITARIKATNKASRDLIPQTHGGVATLVGDLYSCEATIGRWFQAVGSTDATAAFKAANNQAKLDDMTARGLI